MKNIESVVSENLCEILITLWLKKLFIKKLRMRAQNIYFRNSRFSLYVEIT